MCVFFYRDDNINLFVTKTFQVWITDGLKLAGVLRGHKRGIWCVRFSPIDQVLATTSADTTAKLWSLSDFSCLKVILIYSKDSTRLFLSM